MVSAGPQSPHSEGDELLAPPRLANSLSRGFPRSDLSGSVSGWSRPSSPWRRAVREPGRCRAGYRMPPVNALLTSRDRRVGSEREILQERPSIAGMAVLRA